MTASLWTDRFTGLVRIPLYFVFDPNNFSQLGSILIKGLELDSLQFRLGILFINHYCLSLYLISIARHDNAWSVHRVVKLDVAFDRCTVC